MGEYGSFLTGDSTGLSVAQLPAGSVFTGARRSAGSNC